MSADDFFNNLLKESDNELAKDMANLAVTCYDGDDKTKAGVADIMIGLRERDAERFSRLISIAEKDPVGGRFMGLAQMIMNIEYLKRISKK